MTFPAYYDRHGQPISQDEWVRRKFHSGTDYSHVGATAIDEDWWVSTVWLGLDHAFIPGEGPMIFETMIFYHGAAPDSLHPELQEMNHALWRYRAEDEAIAGHDTVCINLRVLLANVQMADEVLAEAIEAAKKGDGDA